MKKIIKEIAIFVEGKLKCIIPDNDSAPVSINNVKDIYRGQEVVIKPFISETEREEAI